MCDDWKSPQGVPDLGSPFCKSHFQVHLFVIHSYMFYHHFSWINTSRRYHDRKKPAQSSVPRGLSPCLLENIPGLLGSFLSEFGWLPHYYILNSFIFLRLHFFTDLLNFTWYVYHISSSTHTLILRLLPYNLCIKRQYTQTLWYWMVFSSIFLGAESWVECGYNITLREERKSRHCQAISKGWIT